MVDESEGFGMSFKYHSTFTPSESDGETLEFLFVAREPLAGSVLEGIRESATSGNKHQRLLIGPRGIGKTHFVSLVCHRVGSDHSLSERVWVAWLREDLYIAGYADFQLEILRRLAEEYKDQVLERAIEGVLDLIDPDAREAVLEKHLADFIGEKTLLLIMENLDDILVSLKDGGQKKLRAFIENHQSVTILATSTSLIDAVSQRKKTFFGFFRVNDLSPLNLNEAVELLTRLAERKGDTELVEALNSPMGYARIRAVHYLAGGNPRIYALFFDFLETDSLDDLERPFMKLIDDLTPYYQSRMDRLAPLQRRILDTLRRFSGAATVKKIARQAMNTSQSISAQLGKLRELGYVLHVGSKGQHNYYEMREPLMRLCLEVKEQRGRQIGLFIQFLRVWYSETELDQMMHGDYENSAYLLEAAREAKAQEDPLQPSLAAEFSECQASGNHEQALVLADLAISRNPGSKENWFRKVRYLDQMNRDPEERLVCWQRLSKIDPDDWEIWHGLGLIHREIEQYEEALKASLQALELNPEKAFLYRIVSNNYFELGQESDAVAYMRRYIKWEADPKSAAQWKEHGHVLWTVDRKADAINAYLQSLELDPLVYKTWDHLLGVLQDYGRYKRTYSIVKSLVDLNLAKGFFQSKLGVSWALQGEPEKAIHAFDQALFLDDRLNEKDEPVFLWKALCLNHIGKSNKARVLLKEYKPQSKKREIQGKVCRIIIHLKMLEWAEAKQLLQHLLFSHRPVNWIAKEIFTIIRYLLWERDLHSKWEQVLSLFVKVFSDSAWLPFLGTGVVKSLRNLRLPWINADIARGWLYSWQMVAGDMEEMKIPLRLLGAGIEYYASGDQTALLDIPKEERGLLEPWLSNIVNERPDPEVDPRIDGILEKVKSRLAENAEKEAT